MNCYSFVFVGLSLQSQCYEYSFWKYLHFLCRGMASLCVCVRVRVRVCVCECDIYHWISVCLSDCPSLSLSLILLHTHTHHKNTCMHLHHHAKQIKDQRIFFKARCTTVARKRSWSFCQKCRWQVTAKHTYTLPMWLWMKCYCKLVYGWMVYTELALKRSISRGTSHATTKECYQYTTSMDIKNRCYKKLQSLI